MIWRPLRSTLFPYTTLFRSGGQPPLGRRRGPRHPPALAAHRGLLRRRPAVRHRGGGQDRKSTRLNSSHGYISYAVFCLKKKKETINILYKSKDITFLIDIHA